VWYATTNDATTNECYNEQFLSIKSGCYNEQKCYNEQRCYNECSQTWIHSSKRRTNTLQPMNLLHDNHPRWGGTM